MDGGCNFTLPGCESGGGCKLLVNVLLRREVSIGVAYSTGFLKRGVQSAFKRGEE